MLKCSRLFFGLVTIPHIVFPTADKNPVKKKKKKKSSRRSQQRVLSEEAIKRILSRDVDDLDEEECFDTLGILADVSPEVPGFEAYFRQQWQDFHVTEMISRHEKVSREWDKTVPSLPSNTTSDDAGESLDIFAPPSKDENELSGKATESQKIVECVLHKQHVSHSMALSAIAASLRIHPRNISVAGIKDFIGDTVQRVRIENVTPQSILNSHFQMEKHLTLADQKLRLSNFRYADEALNPGDLFGNHFKIVLRGVTASREDVKNAISVFEKNGFANFYGCQRFSWFGGLQDPSLSVLRNNFLDFAFKLLDFTGQGLSLRDLLQRKKKYLLPFHDAYRRRVIYHLRNYSIEPTDLDSPIFIDPSFAAKNDFPEHFSPKEKFAMHCLRAAFMDLEGTSRRLCVVRFSNFLWNLALSLRLEKFGTDVLEGDLVVPRDIRNGLESTEERGGWFQAYKDVVTPQNIHRYTIHDVLHPPFAFNGIELPQNPVRDIYLLLCERYSLNWRHNHTKQGISDLIEAPRPIVASPLDLEFHDDIESASGAGDFSPKSKTSPRCVTLQFALERGCYANIAMKELLKTPQCPGQEDIAFLPLHKSAWEKGRRDPAYIETFQDAYPNFIDGFGFINEDAEPVRDSEPDVWSHEGPFFAPASHDPFVIARKWSKKNLVKEVRRREQREDAMKRELFEPSLHQDVDIGAYATHAVPLAPNTDRRAIMKKLNKRRRMYPNFPKFKPLVQLGADVKSRKKASYRSLNKDTWNRLWK